MLMVLKGSYKKLLSSIKRNSRLRLAVAHKDAFQPPLWPKQKRLQWAQKYMKTPFSVFAFIYRWMLCYTGPAVRDNTGILSSQGRNYRLTSLMDGRVVKVVVKRWARALIHSLNCKQFFCLNFLKNYLPMQQIQLIFISSLWPKQFAWDNIHIVTFIEHNKFS